MAYMDPMGYIRRIVSSDQFMISHNADNYGHNLPLYCQYCIINIEYTRIEWFMILLGYSLFFMGLL